MLFKYLLTDIIPVNLIYTFQTVANNYLSAPLTQIYVGKDEWYEDFVQ